MSRPSDTVENIIKYLVWLMPAWMKLKDDSESKHYAIAKIWADMLEDVRTNLKEIPKMAYITSSTDEYLERLGKLRQVKRKTGESDDDYMVRVLNAIYEWQTYGTTASMDNIFSAIGFTTEVQENYAGTTWWNKYDLIVKAWDYSSSESDFYALLEKINAGHAIPILDISAVAGCFDDWDLTAIFTIIAFADASGSVTVTTTGHTFSDDDYIEITGTTNYDGLYLVSNVSGNNFDIVHAWDGNDATGSVLKVETFDDWAIGNTPKTLDDMI